MPLKKKPLPKDTTALTRSQRKAQTRALLIRIGRKEILRSGLAGATIDRICKEAGYTRGAFYMNFDDIEDMFLDLLREEQKHQIDRFRSVLQEATDATNLLNELRKTFVEIVTAPDWIIFRVELEAAALRNDKLRLAYGDLHKTLVHEARKILSRVRAIPGVHLSASADESILAMLTFSHGMAALQCLLGQEISLKKTRKTIEMVFNALFTSEEAIGSSVRSQVSIKKKAGRLPR